MALSAIALALAIMLVPTVRRYLAQREEITALEHSIVEQQKQVDALAQERARWDDPDYVEQQVRARLHFVKPGETGYTVVDPEAQRPHNAGAQVVGVDLESKGLPWYGQVWSSLRSADKLGADPTTQPSVRPTAPIVNTEPAPAPSTTTTRPGR